MHVILRAACMRHTYVRQHPANSDFSLDGQPLYWQHVPAADGVMRCELLLLLLHLQAATTTPA
jgi:hypothetical protein